MEFTIRCMSCNLDIVDIFDVEENKDTKIRARCPKCKDLTFFYQSSHNIKYHGCNNICITDIIEDGNTIILETI